MRIKWQREPRRGFVAAHWTGADAAGRRFSIWPKVRLAPFSSRERGRKTTYTLIPTHKVFETLAAAKAAAETETNR